MAPDSSLRDLVRAAMQSGRVPVDRPARVWGDPADGATTCAVRLRSIGLDQFGIEFPVEAPSASVHLHVICFNECEAVWWGNGPGQAEPPESLATD